MATRSSACEKNSDQRACLSTLGRLSLPCMTPVRAERVPLARPLAARHLSAHDVSLDLHRGVGDRDEPRGVSVGVITRGVSARAGLGCQSEVDPGDHDSGR